MVRALLGHDVWDERCEVHRGTDVAAAVGVGAVMLLMAATDTAHHPCDNGRLVAAAATTELTPLETYAVGKRPM